MSRPRSFDYDECRALWASGEWMQTELAEKYGVSKQAIRYALYERAREYQLVKQRSYRTPCVDCATLTYRKRCRTCAAAAKVTTVRKGELQCTRCRTWKTDDAFPSNRSNQLRRGRHEACRGCQAALKREYRARHREASRAYDREYKRRVRAAA